MNLTEILREYTEGKKNLEETNAALAEIGYPALDPKKNVLTEEEIRKTTIGAYPDMANGWGLLDTGTGTMDKVKVENGVLVNGGVGKMMAFVIIAGKTYGVDDDKLIEG